MRFSYLKKNILLRLLVLVIADIELFWYILSGWNNYIAKNYLWLQIVLMTILTTCAYFTVKTLKQFIQGFEGEEDVKEILNKLPNEYHRYYDILVTNRGNIDAVVVGPTGICTIEVKSHSGKIRFEDNELKINGYRSEKDFLKQAYAEAAVLKDYISGKLGQEIKVHPILVFSSRRAWMKFGMYPVKGVYVINAKWLNKLICGKNESLNQEELARIVSILEEKPY